MIFIDGLHEKSQVYKDFINSKDRIIEDGLIVLHDTYPMDDAMIQPWFCHDAWEAAQKIKKEFRDEFEMITLPFNPGISIMKKMRYDKQLTWK